MEKTLQKRNVSLDIARIVATFAVVMIHCSADFVSYYPVHSKEFITGNLLDSLSRFAVPVFVMLSGALFLDERKEVTLKTALLKYAAPILVITVVWSVVYSGVYQILMPMSLGKAFSIKSFLLEAYRGYSHMWYLYMIVGLYTITPFLKKFVSVENKNMVLFFILLSLGIQFFAPLINMVSRVWAPIDQIKNWAFRFNLGFFDGYLAYYLMGWYILNVGRKQKLFRWAVWVLGAISFLTIFLYTHFTGDHENAYKNIGILVFLYSSAVFLTINSVDWKLKEKTAQRLAALSKLTFGVYIVHMMILRSLLRHFPYSKFCGLYMIGLFVAVSAISFGITYVLSRIPILKKIVRA